MLGAVINILLNFILIPSELILFGVTVKCAGLGVQGATVATLVSYLAVFLARALDTRRLLKFDMHIVRLFFSGFIMILGAVSMLLTDKFWILISLQALFLITIIAINIKPLIQILKTIFFSKKN
jgi:Na+-driven multidrug efflux pump